MNPTRHRLHVPGGGTFEAWLHITPNVGDTISTLETGVEPSVFLVVAVHHFAVTDPRLGIPAAEVHVVPATP